MPDRVTTSAPRRGRPRAGERQQRRQRVIDAAFAELVEHGYESVTMLGIARRAGASKETLYSWFGNRQGLFAAMIEDNGDRAAAGVRRALSTGADPRRTLTDFGVGLLSLLVDERGVALNRAAMSSPELAAALLAGGRHRVGPIVEDYLASLDHDGVLAIDEPATAFGLLYGLLVQDTQIRVLLGERPPSTATIAQRAAEAVDRLFQLCAPPP